MLTYFHKIRAWIKRNLFDVILFGGGGLMFAFILYIGVTVPSPEAQAILEVENRLGDIEKKLDSVQKIMTIDDKEY